MNTMAMPWSHITIVFDLVRGLTFYKNGDLVETVGYGEDPGFPAELKSLFETSGFKAKPLVLGSPMCSSISSSDMLPSSRCSSMMQTSSS